jgi:hypothetical protein
MDMCLFHNFPSLEPTMQWITTGCDHSRFLVVPDWYANGCCRVLALARTNSVLNAQCVLRDPVIIYGGGVAPKRNVFLGKKFADPTIKKTKIWLPNFKYQLINNYPPLAKNRLQKDTMQLSHMSFTTSVTRVCENFCSLEVSCCLHMYFLWKHHLFCQNDQDSDSDWFTYCSDKWLLTLLFIQQYFIESCFEIDNKFLLPNPWVVLFFIYPTFYLLKILFTQPFSLLCHPPP